MLSKITERVSRTNDQKLVTKVFQRNLKTITTQSAYSKDVLYFRRWVVEGYKTKVARFQAYIDGKPVKSSRAKFDYMA